jgi:hypothetical protein
MMLRKSKLKENTIFSPKNIIQIFLKSIKNRLKSSIKLILFFQMKKKEINMILSKVFLTDKR